MTLDPDTVELRRGDARYEALVAGELASQASYHRRGDVVVLPHTETDPAFGGQGLAGRLVRFALDDIRSQGLMVEPACPFVADWIAGHPEYSDLVA